MKRSEIYQKVTDSIIAQLESVNVNDYNKPWFAQGSQAPVNLRGTPYRGINSLLLSMSGYDSNVWGTFKQWKEKKCTIIKGQKATMVVLWKFFKGKKDKNEPDSDDNQFQSCMVRYFNVFNSTQVDGDYARSVEEKQVVELEDHKPIEIAENYVNDYLKRESVKRTTTPQAYYSPASDSISMPALESFVSPFHYYSVFAHEIAHSTGAKTRLDRDLSGKFGGKGYAFEELIAELSSAMVCTTLGLQAKPRVDHAQYIKSWLKALNDDNSFIISAASQAQKASDFALNEVKEKVEA